MSFDTYIRFAVALLIVLGLIAGIAWLVRRFGWGGKIAPVARKPIGERRLSVVEACNVDGKRRLVLVRRDGVEHLVMLTSNGSAIVVERGIGTTQSFRKTLARKKRSDASLREDQKDDDLAAEIEAAAPLPAAQQMRGMR
jgi:flagellar protein FliO/FliZ